MPSAKKKIAAVNEFIAEGSAGYRSSRYMFRTKKEVERTDIATPGEATIQRALIPSK